MAQRFKPASERKSWSSLSVKSYDWNMRYNPVKLPLGGLFRTFAVNKVVRNFVLADLVLYLGWGLISPIFAVFIIQNIPGATLGTVGLAIGLYWLSRAIIQLPVALYLDKSDGEKDDFYVLLLGLILASLAAFSFNFVRTATELYAVEVIQALGFGFYAPAWSGIFNRHLDKERVAFDLSLDSTVLALASGVTALLGGLIAETMGFKLLFIIGGIFSLLAAVIIFLVPELILPKTKNPPLKLPLDHTPRTTQP